jgi:WD40 repeat protein
MADVFISYSRKDIAFARLLNEALGESQLETWIDWARIPIGEKWWQEISEAIEGANVFMLLISRHSVGSKVCRDEIELALKNHKRIVPVLVDQLTPEEIGALAPDLPQFNWVVFERDQIFRVETDPSATADKAEDREVAFPKLPQFQEALAKLSVAIHTDWEWVKYHTGLQVEALRWDNNGRDPSYLIRGSALEEAEQKLIKAAGHDPAPTSLQVEFVTAARQEETRRQLQTLKLERQARRRQRYVLAAVAIGLIVSSTLGVVAWGQRNQYLDEAHARATAETVAEQQRQVAVEQRQVAVQQKQVADEQRNIAVSRQLAADAINQIDSQQLDEGMLLAIEADRQADTMDARSSLLRLILDTPQLRFIIAGHSDQVHGVAVSPDGKTIASASADGTIGLWSTATGKASHAPLKATEGGFWSVAFSPDGKYLATGEGGKTGSAGGQIVLWDVAGGYTPQVLAPGGGYWVDGLAFSHDGKTLAAATADASGTLYSVAGHKAVCPSIGKKADEEIFDAIALSPDGKEVAFGTGRGGTEALSIWSTATCKQVGPAIDTGKLAGLGPNEGGWITSLSYSPDGKQLAVADGSYLLVLDTATRLPVRSATLIDPNSYVESLTYSPDGTRIALASKREIELLDASTGKQVGSQLLGPRGSAQSVAFGADGHSMAAGSSSGDVEVYDLQNEPLTAKVPTGTTAVGAVAFSADGKVLASAGAGGVIRLWNTTTWKMIGQTAAGGGAVPPLAFSPDGKVLASVGDDKLVHLWDAATGRQLGAPLDPKGGEVWCLAFSPDGKWLATGGVEDLLTIWDVAGAKLVASRSYGGMSPINIYDMDKAIRSVGFEPDSSGLFFTMASGIARIASWGAQAPASDWTTRDITFITNPNDSNDIEGAMSPDGTTLALANVVAIRQYDVASGKMLGLTMFGHNNTVAALAYSPDGKLLASGGMDSIVRLWDSATGQPVGLPLLGPSKWVADLSFSADGAQLVGVDGEGSIYVWDMVMTHWESLACGIVGRNLSGLEWQQFMPDEPYRLTCPNQPIDPSGIYQLVALARTQQTAGNSDAAKTIVSDGLQWVVASTDADANNAMCWVGSLSGFAAQVMPACERAVALAPPAGLANIRDSRGVARAITGDYAGAIADFQAMVEWANANGQADTTGTQRQGWITTLKTGKNPFDQALLDELLTQGAPY